MERVIYEYEYDFCDGYNFKKQICINDDKKIIFNFIVSNHCYSDLLLSNIGSDFKDSLLKEKIKEFMLKEIRGLVYIKTLFLTIRNKGEKATIEILKNGIKFDGKVFKLKNNDYHSLEYQLLDYINDLKNNVK